MNKYVKGIFIGMGLAMMLPFGVFAMTGAELRASHQTEYMAGTNSVYGPALTQVQLDELSQVIADFVNQHITENMTDEQKIREIHNYMFRNVSYAESWSKNSANTAYGALVNHTAQCSGFARGFKAMCDAVGIECYYVHADAAAFNPSHQWNIVKYNGQYYHMDVQENCLGKGGDSTYLSATHVCSYNDVDYPQIAAEDAPVVRYFDGDGPYASVVQSHIVYDFPGEENIWVGVVSDAGGPVGMVDYGVCQAIQLSEDVNTVVIEEASPYDESKYGLQMAIIPYKGKESRERGQLVVALEGQYLTNFQYIKKGEAVNIDPLGLGRSGPELAKYCRENDIFFELVIFDGKAYRKYEQEHGAVSLNALFHEIPGMMTWLTY